MDVTLRGGDSIGLMCDWMRQGLSCFDHESLSVPGTSANSQVPSVHKAAANPPPSCPQGVKCAPNPFLLTPSHSRPTAEGLSERRTWPTQRSLITTLISILYKVIWSFRGHLMVRLWSKANICIMFSRTNDSQTACESYRHLLDFK